MKMLSQLKNYSYTRLTAAKPHYTYLCIQQSAARGGGGKGGVVELNSLPPIIVHPAAHIKWLDICVNMVVKGVYVRVTAGMCVAGVKCLPEYIYIFHFILKIL